MTQYINKAAVAAELEKAIDGPAPSHDQQCPWEDGYYCGLYKAESILDTLKVEELWKPADGDDLPEIDREVVVFTQDFPNDAGIMKVAIAHRPNPNGWDGKSIATGEIEHYTPETYDKGGWNIPNVVIWLDLELPKMEENDV